MDSSSHDPQSRSPSFHPAGEARPSIEAVLSTKLTKKRSVSRSQYKSRNPPLSPHSVTGESKVRKGSLRDAVRKIFAGRRANRDSCDVLATPDAPISSTRRPPSASETLFTRRETAGHDASSSIAHQRIASAPAPLNLRSTTPRTRSPFAVEFPRSARLKPLDLGNPFDAPGSQLRRRKTLPSIHIPDNDVVLPSTSVDSSAEVPPVPSLTHTSRDTPTPEAAAAAVKSARRKSRSVDDLKSAAGEAGVLRKRSDEIRYWRESFPPPDVLRASGFVTHRPLSPEQKQSHPGDKTPVLQHSDLYKPVDTAANSPPSRYVPAARDFDTGSGSGFTELSRELEDRVASLESGLSNFRRDLQRLATERNRRTVLVHEGRPSMDERSPSMLAETLRTPVEHSAYQYGYGRSDRETPRPRTPHAQPPLQPPATRFATFAAAEDPFTERAAPSQPATTAEPAFHVQQREDNANPPLPHTFRSLYEMLSDERFARRKLETQLKKLRNEIQDLQHQVSSSQLRSERSSYGAIMADPLPRHGSVRLHHLLLDTAPSPPRASTEPRDSGATGLSYHDTDRVVSRFSASESETGPAAPDGEDGDEPTPTPQDEYETPGEEWNAHEHGFATARRDAPHASTMSDNGMF